MGLSGSIKVPPEKEDEKANNEVDLSRITIDDRIEPATTTRTAGGLHVLRHAQSAVREPAYHAERREIVGAA